MATFGGFPALAGAAYPGGAGELVYQDSYSYWDPLNNGATTYDYYLTSARPPQTGSGQMLACTGSDVGFYDGPAFCAESGASFSPDGGTLVSAGFEAAGGTAGTTIPDQTHSGGSSLIVAGADGRGARLVQPGIWSASQPAFMPDGTTVVFTGQTSRTARPTQLYVVGVDGTGLRQITSVGASGAAPCPNGTVLYVHRGDVYLLSAELRDAKRLTFRGGAFPDCSQDSRTMVFLRHGTLFTLNTTGKHLRRLGPKGNAADARPTLSPSGGAIAYVAADICTTRSCRRQSNGDRCDFVTYRLKVINLRGKLERSYRIGSNACTTDGDLGGDSFSAVTWQPLPASSTGPASRP